MSRIIAELRAAGADEQAIRCLCAAHGGLPLYVPRTVTPDHNLARIAGWPLARILARLYGGETIYVPLGAEISRAERDRQIVSLAHSGCSATEIARRHHLHVRHVRRILSRYRERREA